jgi:Uma2 family endonuclease
MTTVQTQRMTAGEFYEWVNRAENRGKGFELERGEVVEVPPPGKHHGFVCGNLSGRLWVYAEATGIGYHCTNDSGVIVETGPDTVRGPDVCFYLDAETSDTMERRYSETPPALVVEVFSPSDHWGKMLIKIGQYLRRGVRLVWVVDPESRTVSVHHNPQDFQVRDETEELTGEDVLPGFRVSVADIFRRPEERTPPGP